MNPLLIFGASTRAAAFSAIRAGFDPICGDMFADADLRAWAKVLDVLDYPAGLVKATANLPSLPWIYTGALENSPRVVESICERHTLLGNKSESLRRSRDPWFCAETLRQRGLPTLNLCSSSNPPPRNGRWLMKPLRSAGGRGITEWGPTTTSLAEPHYFQEFIEGTPISATFQAGPDSLECLGVSQQLIGSAELHAPQFGYCGSILPCYQLDLAGMDEVHKVATAISRACHLRGLFGIDFILDDDNVWMTEVNPRYTASMELCEFHSQESVIEKLMQPSQEVSFPDVSRNRSSGDAAFCAKVIFYADRCARAPDLSHLIPREIRLDVLPQWADIPVAGTEIHPGQPVFTCLGTGTDSGTLFAELVQRATDLWTGFH